jgi:hypothetical protein
MDIILGKEGTLITTIDYLYFGIKYVTFETKVINRYGTFDQIINKSMEDPGYAYLHCDLLDKVTLTTIYLKMKLPHIKMHEQRL